MGAFKNRKTYSSGDMHLSTRSWVVFLYETNTFKSLVILYLKGGWNHAFISAMVFIISNDRSFGCPIIRHYSQYNFVDRNLNNAWYNKALYLIGKPYLAINTSNVIFSESTFHMDLDVMVSEIIWLRHITW